MIITLLTVVVHTAFTRSITFISNALYAFRDDPATDLARSRPASCQLNLAWPIYEASIFGVFRRTADTIHVSWTSRSVAPYSSQGIGAKMKDGLGA